MIKRDITKLEQHQDPAVKAVGKALNANVSQLNAGLTALHTQAQVEEQRAQFAKLKMGMEIEEQELKIQHLKARQIDVKNVRALIHKAFNVPIDNDVSFFFYRANTHDITHTGSQAAT